MNILVIGNGFDLAHGLPTKYTDFLNYVQVIRGMMEQETIGQLEALKIPIQVKKLMNHTDWREILNNNIWIDYFLQCEMYQKENWIDFESEISRIIQSIDNDMQGDGANINAEVTKITDSYFYRRFIGDVESKKQEIPNREITYSQIILRLEKDLNKLIRALEIYLTDYVENIECNIFSPDIEGIVQSMIRMPSSFCKVLNFNYTNTCQKIYVDDGWFDFDYIHGKAYRDNIIETNNMVLGIDEYLPDKRRNSDTEFIAFKKYYQRIQKETGCKYKLWVDEIRSEWEKEPEESKAEIRRSISLDKFESVKIHKLYIFGHSLDITDRDVLRELILNDNVHTTIFYHTKEELGKKIANLVKVIGQDELIKRTGGTTKTIEFAPQQEMKEKN